MTKLTRALKFTVKSIFWIFIFSAVFYLGHPAIAAPSLSETNEAVLVAKAITEAADKPPEQSGIPVSTRQWAVCESDGILR